MDTKTLLAEAKARFNHNSAKDYLAEKFQNKLLIAEQGGLWKADSHTIATLGSFTCESLVLIDTFNNPVLVDRDALLKKLQMVYVEVMTDWYHEWKELEANR